MVSLFENQPRALNGAKNPEIGAISDLAEIWHIDQLSEEFIKSEDYILGASQWGTWGTWGT